jgi:hypothetical protein
MKCTTKYLLQNEIIATSFIAFEYFEGESVNRAHMEVKQM